MAAGQEWEGGGEVFLLWLREEMEEHRWIEETGEGGLPCFCWSVAVGRVFLRSHRGVAGIE